MPALADRLAAAKNTPRSGGGIRTGEMTASMLQEAADRSQARRAQESSLMEQLLSGKGTPEQLAKMMGPAMGMLAPLVMKVPVRNQFGAAARETFKELKGGRFSANEVKVIKNPTKKQAESFREGVPGRALGSGSLRAFKDPQTQDVFMWDALDAIHADVAEGLGIDFGQFSQGGRERTEQLVELNNQEDIGRFLKGKRLRNNIEMNRIKEVNRKFDEANPPGTKASKRERFMATQSLLKGSE